MCINKIEVKEQNLNKAFVIKSPFSVLVEDRSGGVGDVPHRAQLVGQVVGGRAARGIHAFNL